MAVDIAGRTAKGSDEGFTLAELLVVIMIVGILATISITVLLRQQQKGWDAAVSSDLRNAAGVQHAVLAGTDPNRFASVIGELSAAGFRPSDARNYFGGTTAITVSAVEGTSYCMTARSGSGKFFAMSSQAGLRIGASAFDPFTCD